MNITVFVGHSLFFKAFYSKRISKLMNKKRPHLSANLKRFRLSKKFDNLYMYILYGQYIYILYRQYR